MTETENIFDRVTCMCYFILFSFLFNFFISYAVKKEYTNIGTVYVRENYNIIYILIFEKKKHTHTKIQMKIDFIVCHRRQHIVFGLLSSFSILRVSINVTGYWLRYWFTSKRPASVVRHIWQPTKVFLQEVNYNVTWIINYHTRKWHGKK